MQRKVKGKMRTECKCKVQKIRKEKREEKEREKTRAEGRGEHRIGGRDKIGGRDVKTTIQRSVCPSCCVGSIGCCFAPKKSS